MPPIDDDSHTDATRTIAARSDIGAIELLRSLVERDPNDVRSWFALAERQHEAGQFAAAEFGARRAIELSPAWRAPRRLLAACLVAQGKRQEASKLDSDDDAAPFGARAASDGRRGAAGHRGPGQDAHVVLSRRQAWALGHQTRLLAVVYSLLTMAVVIGFAGTQSDSLSEGRPLAIPSPLLALLALVPSIAGGAAWYHHARGKPSAVRSALLRELRRPLEIAGLVLTMLGAIGVSVSIATGDPFGTAGAPASVMGLGVLFLAWPILVAGAIRYGLRDRRQARTASR